MPNSWNSDPNIKWCWSWGHYWARTIECPFICEALMGRGQSWQGHLSLLVFLNHFPRILLFMWIREQATDMWQMSAVWAVPLSWRPLQGELWLGQPGTGFREYWADALSNLANSDIIRTMTQWFLSELLLLGCHRLPKTKGSKQSWNCRWCAHWLFLRKRKFWRKFFCPHSESWIHSDSDS